MRRYGLLIVAMVVVACTQKSEIQSEYYGFENQTWKKNSPIEFTFEIPDTSTQYSLEASLRYNESFNFNALNINVSLLSPSGSSRFQGVSLEMKNNDGTLRGDKKPEYIELSFVIYSKLRFNENGNWVLNVMHKMPIDITRGLVGIEFELIPVVE